MIDLGWLSDRLVEVLKWQLANPGAKDGPDAPEVPMAGRRVWSIFLELNASRTSGGMAPNPISGVEIEAYSRLRREPVRSFEVTMLRALDGAYMEAGRAGQQETEAPTATASERPMTPALFDAVFGR